MDFVGLRLQKGRYYIVDNQHERVGRWIEAQGAGHWRDGTTCIGLEKDGELIAGVMYDWFNGASIYAHIAAKKLTRHFNWFICYYPFKQLGAKTVIGLVSPKNHRSRRFCERFGFKLFCAIPDAHPDGEQLVYVMHKDQCKWIRHEQTRVATTA